MTEFQNESLSQVDDKVKSVIVLDEAELDGALNLLLAS